MLGFSHHRMNISAVLAGRPQHRVEWFEEKRVVYKIVVSSRFEISSGMKADNLRSVENVT